MTGFQYAIYKPAEAPKSFRVLRGGGSDASGGEPSALAPSPAAPLWEVVAVQEHATNTGCTPPAPRKYSRVVNTSTTLVDSIAIKTRTIANSFPSGSSVAGRVAGTHADSTTTVFAVCYGTNATSAEACAAEAVESMDVAKEMANRNSFILNQLSTMPAAGDDKFQRKLLSVMKVNSMSAEGEIAHNWSTTCRAPHKWMYLWDGMMQVISMSHVDPRLAMDYVHAFLQFQDQDTGQMCSMIGPPSGRVGGKCSQDAMCPNVAIAVWDNFQQNPDKGNLAVVFPKLERYIEWDRSNRQGPPGNNITYLLWWGDAGSAGMDHEQTFCPGNTYWTGGCTADHYAVDFAAYIIYEAQALAKMATVLGLADRAKFWSELAANTAAEMDALLWDEATGFYYDRYFNGTLMKTKTIAGLYPLMIEDNPNGTSIIQAGRLAKLVAMMKTPDFWTASSYRFRKCPCPGCWRGGEALLA